MYYRIHIIEDSSAGTDHLFDESGDVTNFQSGVRSMRKLGLISMIHTPDLFYLKRRFAKFLKYLPAHVQRACAGKRKGGIGKGILTAFSHAQNSHTSSFFEKNVAQLRFFSQN